MNKLAWGKWLQGLISSVASAVVTVLTALLVLKEPPQDWQLFVIATGPFLINFFSYLKQCPPPLWDGVDRRGQPTAPPKERMP